MKQVYKKLWEKFYDIFEDLNESVIEQNRESIARAAKERMLANQLKIIIGY